MKESNLVHTILDYLAYKRIFCWRNNSGAFKTEKGFYRFGSVGSPDIFCIVGGLCIGLEIKAGKNKQTDWQKQWQKDFEKAGGRYVLAYSLEDVMKYVQ